MGQPETQDCSSGIFVPINQISYKSFRIYVEMNILSILLLTAMVAIEKEQCSGRYLLVDIDDAEGKEREKPGPRCKGPPTHGKCIPKPYHGFTFDPVSKTCKKVMLGGCGRTNNGFLTQEECEAKCKPKLRGEWNTCEKDDDCAWGDECCDGWCGICCDTC